MADKLGMIQLIRKTICYNKIQLNYGGLLAAVLLLHPDIFVLAL